METNNEQPIKDIVDGVVAGAEEKAIENGATEFDIHWFRGVVETAQNSETKNGARQVLQEARENDPTRDRFGLAA